MNSRLRKVELIDNFAPIIKHSYMLDFVDHVFGGYCKR